MVHKMINNRAPSYFNVLFSRVNVQHCYRTRQSLMDITLCRFKTMYGRRSIDGPTCDRSIYGDPRWIRVIQDGAEDGSRVASSGKTLQFFSMFYLFFCCFTC